MIIYMPGSIPNLLEFGIEIPLNADRSQRVFEKFRTSPEKILIPKISPIEKSDILLAHENNFADNLFNENSEKEIIKCYELIDERGNLNRYNPVNKIKPFKDLVNQILLQSAGTKYSMEVALEKGFAFFLGGGLHHAMTFGGRGFCLVNDIVIGIRSLQKDNKIKTAWVIDVDAHKGCGTAEITQGDDSIKTLSIHMGSSWPLEGYKYNQNGDLYPWFIPSKIDIPIEEGEELLYLPKLKEGLSKLEGIPDLAVIVCGSDPYEKDELASTSKLKLNLTQLLERDLMIHEFLKNLGIPQCYLMSGGYGSESHRVYSQFLEKVLT
jgi:acetoin utilization deacetylase AcuC-like enzyme